MNKIKVDSMEGRIITGTVLKYVENIVPKNGVIYKENLGDLDEEGCFNNLIELLAMGRLRLVSNGKSCYLEPVEENPVPKQIFKDSFFGKYEEAKALLK